MGTLFMVNPPGKRRKVWKSRKVRSAKQRAATKKMLAARKRMLQAKRARASSKPNPPARKKGSRPMAKRRRRATVSRRRRRTAKRRSPVTTLRRRSVYVTNPRRRRVRRRFRRNPPPIFRQLQQGAMDAGATLLGGALARFGTGMLPLPKEGLAGVASGFAVAVVVGLGARQVVSADVARFVTAGAMQVPIKNLITTFIPQAGAFLGDYDNIGAYMIAPPEGVSDYLQSGGMAAYGAEDVPYVEAYEQVG